mmetsp:Transcript_43802/g.102853  ORF Transcript_43802/g.102853 Transcript_43802/m.102853 type:complete len:234 (-) Transcript_43802:13-714(-)
MVPSSSSLHAELNRGRRRASMAGVSPRPSGESELPSSNSAEDVLASSSSGRGMPGGGAAVSCACAPSECACRSLAASSGRTGVLASASASLVSSADGRVEGGGAAKETRSAARPPADEERARFAADANRQPASAASAARPLSAMLEGARPNPRAQKPKLQNRKLDGDGGLGGWLLGQPPGKRPRGDRDPQPTVAPPPPKTTPATPGRNDQTSIGMNPETRSLNFFLLITNFSL